MWVWVLVAFSILGSGILDWQDTKIKVSKASGAIIGSKTLLIFELAWMAISAIGFIPVSSEVFLFVMPECEPYMNSRTCGEYDLGNIFLIYSSCAWIAFGIPFAMLLGNIGWNNLWEGIAGSLYPAE